MDLRTHARQLDEFIQKKRDEGVVVGKELHQRIIIASTLGGIIFPNRDNLFELGRMMSRELRIQFGDKHPVEDLSKTIQDGYIRHVRVDGPNLGKPHLAPEDELPQLPSPQKITGLYNQLQAAGIFGVQ